MKRKIEKLDDCDFFITEFDSIWNLIDYLKNEPYNPDFCKRASEQGDYSFTGTNSYEEAEHLCLYGGDKSEFEKFMFLKETLDDSLSESRSRNIQFNDFIGEIPNVPLYLMGYPLNMIRQEREELSSDRIIDIYYNVAVHAGISRQKIFNRGVIALSLIDYLEGLGYKVNLHLFELSTCYDQINLYTFDLKKLDEATDYRNLFFPLTHPSFLRRIIFKLLEKTPGLSSNWSSGYGRPADLSLITKVFNQAEGSQFIFYSPDDMGIYGDDIQEDFRRCVENLGVKEKIENAVNKDKNKR